MGKTIQVSLTSEECEAQIWALAVAYKRANAYRDLYKSMAEDIEALAVHTLGWDESTPSRFERQLRQLKRVTLTWWEMPPGAKYADP